MQTAYYATSALNEWKSATARPTQEAILILNAALANVEADDQFR